MNLFINGPILQSEISNVLFNAQLNCEVGAHTIFLGQVRADKIGNDTVMAIEYTAYEEMAIDQLYCINEKAFSLFPLKYIEVRHSLGCIRAGEICLFVFVSALHRHEAFKASSYIIERIKAELPIWGKEIFVNLNSQWKINK